MKKIIFCDCFGVLIEEIIPNWLPRYMKKEEALLNKDKFCVGFDLGNTNLDQLLSEYAALVKIPKEQVYQEWMDLVFQKSGTISLLKKLQKDHQIYMLSNGNIEFAMPIIKQEHLDELFIKMYISSTMHLIKPSKEYYNFVLDDLKVNPKDCIMIDDNIKNVEGASSLGIHGILFTNAQNLEEEIKKIEAE